MSGWFARLAEGLGGAALIALACLAPKATGEMLTYTFTPQPDTGRLRVELEWQTEGRTSSALCVADRWGQVPNVPALLRHVRVTGAKSGRRDGSCWLIRHRSGATLRCTYTVDPRARVLDWPRAHFPMTTKTFFHGIGNTFLLAPQPASGMPAEYDVLLRWKTPKSWTAVCSWGIGKHLGMQLSVEELRNAVYLAGPLVRHTVNLADGGRVTVAILDEFGFTAKQFAETAADIIAAQCRFMVEAEFPPYLVTVVPVGPPAGKGRALLEGMGLHHSFALFLPPEAKISDAVEHLFAHELFHHWNGSLLRREEPEELTEWFTEGFTDYYALRILHESGRWDSATYAKWINRHLCEYHANPARNATNEQIRRDRLTRRDTVGEVPYQRGLLLGLRWHRLARDRGVAGGLDGLVRTMVDKARTESFRASNERIRSTGIRLFGDWFAGEFERYVVRAETVDVPADALAPELAGAVETIHDFALGFDRKRSLKDKRVRGLVAGSAAAAAGLKEGDELTGWNVHGNPKQAIRLQVRRDGELRVIEYLPRGAERDLLQFAPTDP